MEEILVLCFKTAFDSNIKIKKYIKYKNKKKNGGEKKTSVDKTYFVTQKKIDISCSDELK